MRAIRRRIQSRDRQGAVPNYAVQVTKHNVRRVCALFLLLVFLVAMAGCGGERGIRRGLNKGSGVVVLPDGVTEVTSELRLPPGAHDIEIVGGNGSILKAAPNMEGRAVLMFQGVQRLRLRNFTIDGGMGAGGERSGEIPPARSPFLVAFSGHGLAISQSSDVQVTNVTFRQVAGLAIVANKIKKIKVEKCTVEDSGSRNAKGRNNTTGGILFEDGTEDFEVRDSTFRRILGNAVWTHTSYGAGRNYRGVITGNQFDTIGRDAIQIGHVNRVRVENNRGRLIGYPDKIVDVEGGGIPVGIDTAGNVDEGVYTKNRFEEINGKCIDLDGFHHGEVSENVCINTGKAEEYPSGHFGIVMNNTNMDMESQVITVRDNVIDGTKFGGIFIIGHDHTISGNKLRNINTAKCNESAQQYGCRHFNNEPDLMQAGIYLGMRAERVQPSRDNVVENNEISGHKMKERCVMSAPTVPETANTVRNNRCSDTE